jgi:hypothetical protein
MAAFEVIALDTATPQLRAPGAADTYTFPRAVEMPLGTANGVLYLNGSKVVTSGSGLQFDGVNTLQLFATGNAVVYFEGSSTNNSVLRLRNTTTGALAGFYANDAKELVFEANGTSEQMRLTSTGLGIGTNNPGAKVQAAVADGSYSVAAVGTTKGFRVEHDTAETRIVGVDNTLVGTFQPLAIGGSTVLVRVNGSSLAATFDSSGNLGLGVTPSAWVSYTAAQIKDAALMSSGSAEAILSANAFWGSGGWTYRQTAASSRYAMDSQHRWFISTGVPSAGSPISFTQAMTLDASGNLLVGGTSVYAATITSYGSATRSGGIGIRNSAGTAAGAICTYAAGSGIGSTDIIVESVGILYLNAGGTERARIPAAGGMVVGTAALATNATDGFLYVPTCAGTPTGTPTTQTGTAPIVINTTNNKLYFYSGGAWRDAGP